MPKLADKQKKGGGVNRSTQAKNPRFFFLHFRGNGEEEFNERIICPLSLSSLLPSPPSLDLTCWWRFQRKRQLDTHIRKEEERRASIAGGNWKFHTFCHARDTTFTIIWWKKRMLQTWINYRLFYNDDRHYCIYLLYNTLPRKNAKRNRNSRIRSCLYPFLGMTYSAMLERPFFTIPFSAPGFELGP